MKKYIVFLMVAVGLAVTSCGGEETPPPPPPNNMMNNIMQQGLNKAIEEVGEQLSDSTSMLNEAMDTLKGVLDDNKELIEDKVQEGINALNKSL